MSGNPVAAAVRGGDADTAESVEGAEVADRLAKFFADASEGTTAIMGLRRTSAGFSRENWIFDLVRDGEVVPLILRRDPTASVIRTDRALEVGLLKALDGTAVPAPQVLWADLEGRWFDRPSLIMRREPGQCDYLVLNGDRPLAERVGLAEQLCHLLGVVHRVDLGATGLDRLMADPGPEAARHEVGEWRRVLCQDVDGPYPELEAVAGWLEGTAPASSGTVLVHGDFKPGNVLLDGLEITALLDWETAHLGDPVEDLGLMVQPLRAEEHQIAGAWEAEQICAAYAAATSRTIDPGAIAWWRRYASFKSAVIQLTGMTNYLRGRSDRLFREPSGYLRVLLDDMVAELEAS